MRSHGGQFKKTNLKLMLSYTVALNLALQEVVKINSDFQRRQNFAILVNVGNSVALPTHYMHLRCA